MNDFRTFKGRHEVVFPQSGVVIMEGDNQDTKGKSASGKTNVLLAISYLFGHCPYPATALQSWHASTPFSVEAQLDTDEGPAVLVRGPRGLSLKVGEEKRLTGSKAVEERLDQLCGVTGDLREILTYRDQRDPKKFLAMKDTKLKEFLTTVLRLEGLEREIDAGVKKLGGLEKQAHDDEAALKTWKESVADRLTPPTPLVHQGNEELLRMAVKEAELHHRQADDAMRQADTALRAARQEEQDHAEAARGVFQQDAELHRKVRDSLRARLDAPPSPEGDEEERVALRLVALAACLRGVKDADRQAEAAVRQAAADLLKQETALRARVAQDDGIKEEWTKLTKQALRLSQSICSMCGRQWDEAKGELGRTATRLGELEARLQEIEVLRKEAAALETQRQALVHVPDPQIEKVRQEKSAMEAQLAVEQQRQRSATELWAAGIREQVAAADGQMREANARAAAAADRVLGAPDRPSIPCERELAAAKDYLGVCRLNVQTVTATMEATIARNTEARRQYDQALRLHTDALGKIERLAAAAQVSRQRWQVESDYLDLLRGFRNKIFDEVLDRIGAEASAIVADLPNAQDVSIEFRSERETGAGTIKNEIKPVTYIYGEERPLASSVSGGQFTSIELAVDLAVARVISQRLGCNLNWVILDESFNGHDHITKEACLTMLQRYAADKLVIVVDHASEFKELFQERIVVRLKDKLSTIIQGATP